MNAERNYQKYEDAGIVSYYEKLKGLQECEKHLFDRYLKRGTTILDLGVGGGRTTPYLSALAGRYVGADYSKAMITVCREAFPALEFRHCDATDMAQFPDGEFDAVVFSFNGIDVIRSDEGRIRCLVATARVLKPGGVFIFSSHNAKVLGIRPLAAGARGYKIPWRIIRSLFKSPGVAARTLRSGAFSAGEGYVRDPIHGGMDHYLSTPQTMAPQLERAGFSIVETVGAHYPIAGSQFLTPWYYYSCRRKTV